MGLSYVSPQLVLVRELFATDLTVEGLGGDLGLCGGRHQAGVLLVREEGAVAGHLGQALGGVHVDGAQVLQQNPPSLELLWALWALAKYVCCVDFLMVL